VQHAKLEEILHRDFFDYAAIRDRLVGYQACLFCLGVSSAGMSEADYSRVTLDLTLAAAEAVLKANPGMGFAYVSGQGTDVKSRFMWARVKGRLENRLLAMGFAPAVMFRPAAIQPMDGVRSKTRLYQWLYVLLRPCMPLLVRHFPSLATTSQRLGRAMLRAMRGETDMRILGSVDINRLGIGLE
jgi:uncharacterized protein YbjT (DUF2867 family)